MYYMNIKYSLKVFIRLSDDLDEISDWNSYQNKIPIKYFNKLYKQIYQIERFINSSLD